MSNEAETGLTLQGIIACAADDGLGEPVTVLASAT
jgi:hypothetical protein